MARPFNKRLSYKLDYAIQRAEQGGSARLFWRLVKWALEIWIFDLG